MDMGKDIVKSILDGAAQVAMPALVSTLSICIVFVPVVFLTEPSRSLFVPLAMAVVFAMAASYGLSRTVVPLMSKALLGAEHKNVEDGSHAGEGGGSGKGQGAGDPLNSPRRKNPIMTFFGAIHDFIEHIFESARVAYKGFLEWSLDNVFITVSAFLLFYGLTMLLLPHIGEDFFPAIDAGQLRLHVNARPGTRVEQTERMFHSIENAVRDMIPKDEVKVVIDNIGMPVSGVNYAYSDSQTISEADGEILITLEEHRKHSTDYYQKQIRAMLTHNFPEVSYYFQPADIVTQILNAGLPAPIDIQIIGLDPIKDYAIAQSIKREVSNVPGAVDVCLHQVIDAPQFVFNVDRVKAAELGITQRDVSNSVLVSLSSSFQVAPNFWLNTHNGVNYNLAVQTPQYKIASLEDMYITAITGSAAKKKGDNLQPQLLTNLASYKRSPTPYVVNHMNVQPLYNVFAACQGRDLGSVALDIKTILNKHRTDLPRGTTIEMGGQVRSMTSAYRALLFGLIFALLLVYLMLVVNFQSWTDPLIILMAIPGAFSGILWSLFVTQTTFSIPALMGTIMCVGVASANSILMITFANEQYAEFHDGKVAALNAGFQRFRPVVMTATAMIIGMIPMAIGGGQGGSQNAPIGRAVIGGLTVATFSTLLFVPLIFSLLRQKRKGHNNIEEKLEPTELK